MQQRVLISALALFLVVMGVVPAAAQITQQQGIRRPLPTGVLAQQGTATPLTLVVPVHLERIQAEIVSVNVSCQVTGGGAAAEGRVTGIALPTGELTQEVPVPITFPAGADPRQYTEYNCGVLFCTAQGECQLPGAAFGAPFKLESGNGSVQGTVAW